MDTLNVTPDVGSMHYNIQPAVEQYQGNCFSHTKCHPSRIQSVLYYMTMIPWTLERCKHVWRIINQTLRRHGFLVFFCPDMFES
jgi:hypothetical protein